MGFPHPITAVALDYASRPAELIPLLTTAALALVEISIVRRSVSEGGLNSLLPICRDVSVRLRSNELQRTL